MGNWSKRNANTSASTVATLPSAANVSAAFQQAIDAISGADSDVEKMYQQGKRRTLSDIAMQSVNAGMANTLNMPAAGIAYDEANRAATNTAVAGQKAGLLSELGQTLAGVYGTNVDAQTSLATAKLGADTSKQVTAAQAETARANQALQLYLAKLQNKYAGTAASAFVPSSLNSVFG